MNNAIWFDNCVPRCHQENWHNERKNDIARRNYGTNNIQLRSKTVSCGGKVEDRSKRSFIVYKFN